MEAILVIVVIALVATIGFVMFERGPSARRRTIVERPVERVVERPTTRVVEEDVPVTRRRVVE